MVSDRLHAGNRRAAARKHFQEQPEADRLRHRGRRRQRSKRYWMPAAKQRASQAAADGNQESAHEQICRHHENDSGFAHSSKVDDRDHEENADTDHDGVWQERRHRGNQGSNARGNTHRDRENVIR